MAVTSSRSPSWIKHLDFIVIDLLALAAAFVLAYWLKFGDFGFVDSSKWKGLFVFLLLVNFVITLLIGPYSGIFRRGYWAEIGANLKLAVISFIVASVAFYLLKIGEEYSREMLITTYVVYLIIALLVKVIWKWRLLSRRENKPPESTRRIILATMLDDAEKTMSLIRADDMGSNEVVGVCLIDDWRENELQGIPTASVAHIGSLSTRLQADEVLVAVNPALLGPETLEALIEGGVRVRFAIMEAFGVSSENQTLGRAGALKTLDLERYSFGADQLVYLPIKRILDIVFGIIGCILTLPVAGIVKLIYIKSSDHHPVFYKQVRIGQRGKPFEVHKLRSMVWNADEVLAEILKDPACRKEWEEERKLSNDPRITPVGRFLRRTSLDEFPQFFDVVRGKMSIVGPRPLAPGELEEHGGSPLYNKVKPGITGWWGCNGRSNIEYQERLELEYHYVRHCSLYLDTICVLRTISAVVRRKGAQ